MDNVISLIRLLLGSSDGDDDQPYRQFDRRRPATPQGSTRLAVEPRRRAPRCGRGDPPRIRRSGSSFLGVRRRTRDRGFGGGARSSLVVFLGSANRDERAMARAGQVPTPASEILAACVGVGPPPARENVGSEHGNIDAPRAHDRHSLDPRCR